MQKINQFTSLYYCMNDLGIRFTYISVLLLIIFLSYLLILVCPAGFQVSSYSLPAMSPQNGLLAALPSKMFQICKIAVHIWYLASHKCLSLFFSCHYDTSKCFLFRFSIKDQKQVFIVHLLRDNPFKTSSNFDPYPPTVGSFLILSIGEFDQFLTPRQKMWKS